MKENEIIIYLDIDENEILDGMTAMSFVDNPATQTSWNMFSSVDDTNMDKVVKTPFKFETDNVKRVVTGPAMLAETPIKRFSMELGYYWVKFSEDTIFRMMKKYFMDEKIHLVNENHKGEKLVTDAYMIESFIIGDRVESKLYSNLPKGTWMVSYYIEDEKYWDEFIINGSFNGFSLEGNFIQKYEMSILEERFDEVKEILNSNLGDNTKERKIKRLLNIG